MDQIKNFEDLKAASTRCGACLDQKFAGEGGKRAIVMCGGTGCISSQSMDILAKFEPLMGEKAVAA